MNIINKLTFRHLKSNRSRTVLTIIGICVSTAMITAIFTGLHSYLDYKGRVAVYTYGDYHFSVNAPTDELKDILDNDKRVESYGIEYNLDINTSGYRLKDAEFKYNSIGSWLVGDEEYLKNIITCDYDGALPENSSEILVEEKFITDNNLDWEIGDTVSIESGYRYIGDDFFKFPKKGQYSLIEHFKYSSTDSYKIVGILHSNFCTKNVGSMLIRGADKNQSGTPVAYAKLKNVTPLSIIQINSIIDKFGFSERDRIFNAGINSEYLQTKLAIDKNSDMVLSLLSMCAVVLLLVITASIVLIYNSFAMSLNEKIKYLGMLSSVGATRKQKKKSVIYEALILSAIGIPIGIITGLAVVKITFAIIGERIKASALSGELGSVSGINLDVKVSFIIIALSLIIGVATVLISALIPSKRASNISAIDAIRQSEQIKIKHRIRTPFFIRKIFGYEGELAFKNMRRNGAKSKIIVASIALSLVLFLGCNYFCNMFVISTGLDEDVPYQVSVGFYIGKDGEVLESFKNFTESHPEIKKFYSIENYWLTKDTNEDTIPLLDDFFNYDNFNDDYKELADYQGCITYRVIEDEVFNDLCKKNGIDYKEYYNYEYGCSDYDEEIGFKTKKPVRVLLVNDFNHTDKKAGKPFNENVIGTTQGEMMNPEHKDYLEARFGEDVEITEEMRQQAREMADQEAYKEQFIIHGLVDYDEDNYIFHLDGANSIVAFYPMSVYSTIYHLEEFDDEDEGVAIDFGIETDTHTHTADILNEYFESNEIAASVFDGEEWNERSKATLLVLQVLIYGFIILISIITITNIINTIANSINHRKKEFAMLKSVGLEPKGFKKMLSLESLFYAFEGTLLGIPLSVLACFTINKMMTSLTIPFSMDIKMCVISVCVVFAIIGLTMLYSSAKVRKSSIIEELKIDIN